MSVVIELMIDDHDDDDDRVPAVKGNKYRDYINVLRLISPVVFNKSYETRLWPVNH